ncbi:CLP protease regulatory subunit CLPX1, mitochondrial-like isoform X2 [Lolium rigidum]|uniref:CLP protease regulatory subunit CLPX1, mitochondrial-like isoform X2 n=1 Tax=Lolium rigidum TaxID=89674 RepID=UPI001F5C2361|nr:CLP protease regulatory subunit CLPX1, mitochondrial-like isoform X2 [Lolium rigidum]
MAALGSKLAQLQGKACEATRFVAKHGCAYSKNLLEKNKQYVVEPPTVEKCQELSKQLFYTRLASLPGRYESFWKETSQVKQLWKNRNDLNVEHAGIAALFGLELYGCSSKTSAESNASTSGNDDTELEKSNILLIGPTGSGKTLLAKTLARFANVPFMIADATAITQAGYSGEDVESMVYKLLVAADFNVEAAERGIIYIDEVDKLAKQVGCQEEWRDVSGEGVQQALLKIFEGTVINVPRKRSRDSTSDGYVEVDTKNILFICGGAFSDLGKIISERHRRSPFGFGTPICRELRDHALTNALVESSLLHDVENDDLIAYGLTPEFIGRLPITVGLTHLTEDQLVQVLREPKNAIGKQYKKLFKMNNVKLHITENALRLIAKKAAARETGARGLRSIMEGILTEAMFEIPDAGEGKEKIIAVLVDEESVGPVSRRGCGAKIFRDDGALELYIYQNNIRVPGLIHGPKRNVIFSFCLIVVLSAAKLWVYHTFHCFSSVYAWIVLILCKANIFTQ